MSTNKSKRKGTPKVEFKGYHNVNLNDDMAADFELWKQTNSITFSDLDILANNGYKFSVSWDAYHEGVSASLYCTQAKMEWAGYTLSAWAGDVESAVLLLIYKHYIVCEEQWEVAKDVADKGTRNYG